MIGILGGTFDPIHNGHLHIARQACRRLDLQQVDFMPCAEPVHRGPPRASNDQRCAMIELALADEPRLRLNRLEIERSGPSYTVDSLRALRARSQDKLLLLLGSDAFNGFDGWKEPQRILELAHLAVCLRPGAELDGSTFAERRADSAAALAASPAGLIITLEVDAIDCSSSALRAALERGEIPRRWLHPAVAEYIERHGLYRSAG